MYRIDFLINGTTTTRTVETFENARAIADDAVDNRTFRAIVRDDADGRIIYFRYDEYGWMWNDDAIRNTYRDGRDYGMDDADNIARTIFFHVSSDAHPNTMRVNVNHVLRVVGQYRENMTTGLLILHSYADMYAEIESIVSGLLESSGRDGKTGEMKMDNGMRGLTIGTYGMRYGTDARDDAHIDAVRAMIADAHESEDGQCADADAFIPSFAETIAETGREDDDIYSYLDDMDDDDCVILASMRDDADDDDDNAVWNAFLRAIDAGQIDMSANAIDAYRAFRDGYAGHSDDDGTRPAWERDMDVANAFLSAYADEMSRDDARAIAGWDVADTTNDATRVRPRRVARRPIAERVFRVYVTTYRGETTRVGTEYVNHVYACNVARDAMRENGEIERASVYAWENDDLSAMIADYGRADIINAHTIRVWYANGECRITFTTNGTDDDAENTARILSSDASSYCVTLSHVGMSDARAFADGREYDDADDIYDAMYAGCAFLHDAWDDESRIDAYLSCSDR